ncbi:hypothetical protein AVEN_216780-1 [Araneus ventricosus]|uniref:Uncharacterized protein n=1 Tax=Araneus ventricosus TaxID=182803 RepID=A0A4Y2SZQ5_ARAVE|nr:hypothetical protein AVEN_216780-1 [Araneus ventricosus]
MGCLYGNHMKFAKSEEKALLRVREQENTQTKTHYNSEIAGNYMDSPEESLGIHDISMNLGLRQFITQTSLQRKENAQIGLGIKNVLKRKCF